ncbi:MAG: hypothetical protein HYT79_11815, partial [Elusimicrobia bacterium]|nr:hypothetical protein [Elusimicrobiota bacterium]
MLPQSSIQIKEAFSKVKGDITSLKSQINSLNEEIHEIKETLEILKSLLNTSPLLQAKASLNQTQNQTDQTLRQIQTDTQADKQSQYGLKTQNNNISIGNDGVGYTKEMFKYPHFIWKSMVERGLDVFFEGFLRKESVFFDKRALQSSYTP